MIIKNLIRRKARTLLTVLGISIGIAAIISLGAMANGFQQGYTSMMMGSKADLVLSQPNSFDISMSSVDESIGRELSVFPEVSAVSGMIQGYAQAENEPFFFIFGYPKDSFVLDRFQVKEGVNLNHPDVQHLRGKPIILGAVASEVLDRKTGDSIRLVGSVFRVVGIYETGDAFEDSGGILFLADAQELLGKARQVSLFYIQLKDPSLKDRFLAKIERQYKDISTSGVQEFAEKQSMSDMLQGYVWAIGGLAIVIGGVGMMNSQLMSVFERTREIGVLRAMGWPKNRVMWMILGESITVCLIGGIVGSIIGYGIIYLLSKATVFFGLSPSNVSLDLFIQGFIVVFILGLVGGGYPAWRASRLQPVEALRYEGGSSGKIRRLPFGGMVVQNLWQRPTRTFLTLGAIGLTVGAILALDATTKGAFSQMNDMLMGTKAEIIIRQADISDTSFSAVDERVSEKLSALPEVESISGMIMSAVILPDSSGFFLIQGYNPKEFAIQRFKIIDGLPLSTNHQLVIGQIMAQSLKKNVGDTIELSGTRFRIVGIYESKIGWEQMGGLITLRDAQILAGRPRKVTLMMVKLKDPEQANLLVEKINREYPEVQASLSSDFAEQMPDMESMDVMLNGISFLAIFVGGIGVLNTMLMAVFERTREIGVLRALGWRQRVILFMILKEALLIGCLGALTGIIISFILAYILMNVPMIGEVLTPVYQMDSFVRAILIALFLGIIGGLYPAYRATRLQPVEALRYE